MSASLLTLLYAAAPLALALLLEGVLGLPLALGAGALAALAGLPLLSWLRAAAEARGEAARYPYAEGLVRAGLRLAQTTNIAEATRVLEATLVDVLPVVRGYFYVLEASPGLWLRRVGRVESGAAAAEPMPLRCALEQYPAVRRAVEQITTLGPGDAPAAGGDIWQGHAIELVLPAALGALDPERGEARVRGLLALGAKRVGGGYDARDRALLLDLARHFAVAIANAGVVSRIREERDGLFQHSGELSSALTNLRNVQEAQLEAEQQAIEAEKQVAVGRLAAGIVHEINTPLGTLASSVDTLDRAAKRYRPYVAERAAGAEPDPAAVKALKAIDAQRQPLEVCVASAERISTVLESLKRFVGLDAAEVKLLDICESIDDAITLIKGTVGDQILIDTEFPEPRPVVRCRGAKLNQVLLNLVENAAKAIEGTGSITVVVTRKQREARVEITDSGCGMDDRRLKEVLDVGFTMKREGRVGLRTGLPAARLAIQQLGGTLTVVSVPGEGTRVAIDLPCEASAL